MILIILLAFGLHSIEIEDHYGDMQKFYYNSQNGDVVIYENFEVIGLIDKNWKRIRVLTKEGESMDFYNWVYENKYLVEKIKFYRPDRKWKIDELTEENIKRSLEKGYLKIKI